MPQIDTSTKVNQTFLVKPHPPADKAIWKKAYVKYLVLTNKDPAAASKQRPNYNALLMILKELDQKWNDIKPEWMLTTHKYIHNMNTYLNLYRKEITAISVLMADLQNSPEISLDNDKSRPADATESDKSDDQPEQVDQAPDDEVRETSAFENIDEKKPASQPC